MERPDAMRELPVVYSIALRLRDAGVSAETIAASLDVDVSAVANLLAVADMKLEVLLHDVVSK